MTPSNQTRDYFSHKHLHIFNTEILLSSKETVRAQSDEDPRRQYIQHIVPVNTCTNLSSNLDCLD